MLFKQINISDKYSTLVFLIIVCVSVIVTIMYLLNVIVDCFFRGMGVIIPKL
jgi:hypothetical protein